DHRAQERTVLLVEALLIDGREFKSGFRDRQRDFSIALDGGKIADTPQQPIGHTRRASASTRQFPERLVVANQSELLRIGSKNLVERLWIIKLDVLADPESAPHRARKQTQTRRGTDEGERLHGDRHRTGMSALIERHVYFEVL